jgi:hypothetical protein
VGQVFAGGGGELETQPAQGALLPMLAQATMCGPLATALPVAGGTSGWRSRARPGGAAGHADAGEGDTLPIGDGGLPDVRVAFEEEQVGADLGGLAPGDVGLEGRGEGGGELVRVARSSCSMKSACSSPT